MKRIFIFSGLGTDERVFKYLKFPGCDVSFIKWIVPLQSETLPEYAKRLLQQIDSAKPILIGLSFGGIVAIEVSKLIETEKLILIASAKTRKEVPFYYRIAGKLNLHKLIPACILKHQNFASNWLFGLQTVEDKQLLGEILNDTNPNFLKWAINAIVKWENQTQVKNVIHIHGTSDRILPYRFIKADCTIQNGGHFMSVNKSSEINSILKTLL